MKFLFFSLFIVGLWGKESATICLNMIVKNEAPVIERCLASVKDHIDYWVIVDTGSTDGTQEIIRKFMDGIPGELHERAWKNFEHNRNEALHLAKGKAHYLLFIDADEQLFFSGSDGFPPLTADCYYVKSQKNGNCSVERCLLAKSSIPWCWKGVIHEALAYSGPFSADHLVNVKSTSPTGGARSKDPEKTMREDVRLLEEALATDPNNSRYQFYLGLTCFFLKDYEKAYQAYQKRMEMGQSADEVFWSAYSCGNIELHRGRCPIEWYLKAHRLKPHRVEPLYRLVSYFVKNDLPLLGYMIAKHAISMPPPQNDNFFLEDWIYEWGMSVKLTECEVLLGKSKEAIPHLEKLLKMDLPEDVRTPLRKNYFSSLAKNASG